MNFRFSPEVESRLREAGWHPGRQIDDEELQRLDSLRPLFPAAQIALREFSGLYAKKKSLSCEMGVLTLPITDSPSALIL